ncbi:anthocyanidin 3-O-glucosyltransferase 2-like [Cynara cardunculus var. scolymus]|uniref:anthocyanidin 3-O-glucosyltransferase 2-like n=1 Tax=Cynara cardunculus var. scolymus TaxID=59895 RepID=UPI000D62FD11|nr:anthocyanidin 3-O-glucosyltransferase 2-like [Cynara cardunculus var. scolymus]
MANTIAELVFIPSIGVGHIISTIEIAKLFVNRDQHLSVTIFIFKTPPGSDSGSAITTYVTKSSAKMAMERIRLVELPQDETIPKPDPKAPMTFINEFIKSHCKNVTDAVSEIMSRPNSGRLVGFVIDMFCISMVDVANEFHVPTYVFYTSNAAFLGYKLCIQTLHDTQNQDVLELSNSDVEIAIPSFVNPVPAKVFPAVYQNQEGLEFLLYCVRKFREVKAIMVNTFLELETHAIDSLSSDTSFPLVYPVGPVLNLDDIAGKVQDSDVICWLDGQPPSSVVVLCFGSMGSFEEVQVKEIAYALERSGHRFVWSLRRPPSPEQTLKVVGDYEDPRVVLPEGFLERTAGVGKVIGWAPQVALLAHRAVGGFVSHCGWNSILESLWFGVPTAAWPMYAEQQMNAFEMVVEMGLAVEIKLDYKKDMFNTKSNTVVVTAEEIEGGIRRLMEDKTMRTKVKEISKKSRAAVAEGGSSYAAIGCLIQDFKMNLT